MKILHISHLYPVPYNPLLGIAMHNQIKATLQYGCDVRVIAPTPFAPFPLQYLSAKWHAYSGVPAESNVEGISVQRPRYVSYPRAVRFATSGERLFHGLRGTVARMAADFKFDLIHAHMALPDGGAALRIARQYGKPVVVTFQATDVDITANRSQQCLEAVRRVMVGAAQVIAPSPRLATAVAKRFAVDPLMLPYAMDPREVWTGKSRMEHEYPGRRILLSVSRLIPSKGLDLNIKALARLVPRYPDLTYMIVGDGPDYERLAVLAKDLTVADRVHFTGQLPRVQVMEHIQGSEIFSMPSWQETFGLVYLEAMAHGKPVIGCRDQGVDGIVLSGKTGLLAAPKDVESLVQALDWLLSHPDEARAMGARARQLVLQQYTWPRVGEKLTETYQRLLSRN